jgi:mutator protein MutT
MKLRAIAAVVNRAGEILLCRRPSHKRHGDLWEFPGGKSRPGESTLSTLQRELSEELGVTVRSVSGSSIALPDPGSDYTIEFVPTEILGEPQPLEHTEISWVPADDVADYDLAPADQLFADQHLHSLMDL